MKTWTAFGLIAENARSDSNCVFITQANNVKIMTQTLQRAQRDPRIVDVYRHFQVLAVEDYKGERDGNIFGVGYWHKRTRDTVLDLIAPHKQNIIVVDEAEQASVNGVTDRIAFICDIARRLGGFDNLIVILITATIANLSKSIEKVIENMQEDDIKDAYFEHIVRSKFQVRQVQVNDQYVGIEWYLDNDLVRRITLPKSNEERTEAVLDYCGDVLTENRRLALLCASSRQSDHEELAFQCVHRDLFDVSIELNSRRSVGCFEVKYKSKENQSVRIWEVPYARLCKASSQGKMSYFSDPFTGTRFETHWTPNSVPPLPYIMQAALLLGTSQHTHVRESVQTDKDWHSLLAIWSRIKRPSDYPNDPYIAVVAGNLVNRGMTLTSAQAGFIYTMYMFMDTPDGQSRGATNAQRAGRSFGNIKDACERVRPIILSTNRCIADALANEKIQADLAGGLCILESLVSEDTWKRVKSAALTVVDGTEKRKYQKSHGANTHNIRIVHGKVDGGVLVTEIEHFTVEGFIDAYVKNVKKDAVRANHHPKTISVSLRTGINANLSFSEASAAKVANLRNYYLHPDWAGKPYHIIWKNDQVLVIKKNTKILDAQELPKYLLAHDQNGYICAYAT